MMYFFPLRVIYNTFDNLSCSALKRTVLGSDPFGDSFDRSIRLLLIINTGALFCHQSDPTIQFPLDMRRECTGRLHVEAENEHFLSLLPKVDDTTYNGLDFRMTACTITTLGDMPLDLARIPSHGYDGCDMIPRGILWRKIGSVVVEDAFRRLPCVMERFERRAESVSELEQLASVTRRLSLSPCREQEGQCIPTSESEAASHFRIPDRGTGQVPTARLDGVGEQ